MAPAVRAERHDALDLLDAPVSYSADFMVSSDKGTYRGSVWHVPGRERRDFETNQGGQAILIQRDSDAAYLMKPSGRWYVGIGLRAAASLVGGIDALTVERTRLHEEVVAGIRSTRYRIEATGPRGSRFDGDAWFSKEGIMVRAVGVLSGPDGHRSQVETSLSHVKVGSVDPQMLELPGGWFGMDLRSVAPDKLAQAIAGLRPLLEGRR